MLLNSSRWMVVCVTLSCVILPTCPANCWQDQQIKSKITGPASKVQSLLELVSVENPLHYIPNELYDEVSIKLADLGSEAIPELINVLRDAPLQSAELSLAVDAVCEIGDSRAIPALLEIANAEHFSHYSGQFIKQLAKYGNKIVPSLVELAEGSKRSSSHGRDLAILVLIEIESEAAEPFCLNAIDRRNPSLFHAAIDYFVRKKDASIENRLLRAIDEQKDSVKTENQKEIFVTHSINALGSIGCRENSSNTLLAMLSDSKSPYQNEIVSALGRLKEPRAIPKLIEFLGDPQIDLLMPSSPDACAPGPPQPTRRDISIQALTDMGDASTDELLEIAHTDSRVGQGAIFVLSNQGAAKARSLLEDVLTDRTRDKSIRIVAASGLMRIRDAQSLPALIDALDEQPPLHLTPVLVDSFVGIGEPARQPLLQLVSSDNYVLRGGAISALCKIADPRDFPVISQECADARNQGYTFLSEFLELARKHSSIEIDSALWNIADFDLLGCDAVAILAKREKPDQARLELFIVEKLNNFKYDWQLIRLIDVTKDIWTAAIQEALVPLCGHASSHLADQACNALARKNMHLLLEQIDAGPEQAKAVFRCLEQFGDNQLAQVAVKSALDDPVLVSHAIQLVGKWKWKPAGDQLWKILNDPSQAELHLFALNALREIKDIRLIEALLEKSDSSLIYDVHTITAFGKLSTDLIIRSLESHPAAASAVLTKVRDRRAIPSLKKFLDDNRFEAQHFTVVCTLAEMGDDSAIELLTTRFIRPKRYSTHFVWESLALCPRRKTLPHLERLLGKSKYEHRAVVQLISIGTPDAIDVLRRHYPNASENEHAFIEKELARLGYSLDG